MRQFGRHFWLFIVFVVFSSVNINAQEKKDNKSIFKYGGVATCRACHFTKKSGAQYKIWQADRHAKAYETLKTEKALEAAKKLGIKDPSKSEKCLKCHVTAFGVAANLKGPKLKTENGVGCESCHGPGSAYKGRKIMKDIYEGKVDGKKYGLVMPTEETCVKCHNKENPFHKEFKFAEMAAKIAHPVPEKKK